MNEDTYISRVEQLYERVLRARIVACLEKLAAAFTSSGYDVSGPYDRTDDSYRWYIVVEGQGLREAVDITIELVESLECEGSTDGVNVGLDIVAYGGSVIGGLTPFNYTPECWVPLSGRGWVRKIVGRLQIIEQAEPTSAVILVDEYAQQPAV